MRPLLPDAGEEPGMRARWVLQAMHSLQRKDRRPHPPLPRSGEGLWPAACLIRNHSHRTRLGDNRNVRFDAECRHPLLSSVDQNRPPKLCHSGNHCTDDDGSGNGRFCSLDSGVCGACREKVAIRDGFDPRLIGFQNVAVKIVAQNVCGFGQRDDHTQSVFHFSRTGDDFSQLGFEIRLQLWRRFWPRI